MPKEEWGTKRLCPTTGRRFYDLNKSPIVSPYTGEVVNVETGKTSRVLVADKEEAKPKSKADNELLDDDEDVIDDDDTSDVDLDDDLLDDDDDDDVSLDDIADVASDDEDN